MLARSLWLAAILGVSAACGAGAIGQSITATPDPALQAARNATATAAIETAEPPTPSVTPFPTATLDPDATPVAVHPCLLVMKEEAAGAVGAPVMDGIAAGGGCVFVDSGFGEYLVSAYAVTANLSAQVIAGRAYLLIAYGVQIPPAEVDNMKALGAAGDANGVVESLLTLGQSGHDFTAQPVEGVGDTAIWVSKVLGAKRQGYLLAARGDALVGLDIVVTAARDESSVRDGAVYILQQLLERLPPRFVVAIPTPFPTAIIPTRTPGTASASASASASATAGSGTASASASATETPAQSLTPSAAPTLVTQTVTPTVPSGASATPTLKPPAFSVPIVSSDIMTYGGSCGLSLVTFSVTVADPSQVSPITEVFLMARINHPASGGTTAWTRLPMVADSRNIWLGALNSETQLPGHEAYTQANVEYYFSATNAAGITADSPHYGVQSNQLTLLACTT